MTDEQHRQLLDQFAETRRHFDVVAEGLQAKIEQVAEGVTSLGEQLERFRGEVATEFSRCAR